MKETIGTFKKIVLIDLIIGCILATFIYIFFRNHMISFLLGLLLVIFSFSMNVFGIKQFIKHNRKYKQINFLINLFLRVFLVCVVAIILVKQNKFYIFSYMLGYMCNYMSLTVYGIIV
ncbi:ATP synthase subunit I [Haloimpatiens sp. FM7315]|uniref:ATP synthase subunit I n=1 Tax=Haloimpatiens sp. FM7315 TaxID=3298609 RepID=UPI0035A37E35